MKRKAVLTVSAVYAALVGVGMVAMPQQFGIGAVPAEASPALIAFLRIFGGPMLGIAVLNWLSRNAGPSAMRDIIIVANIVGFGCVALTDVWGVLSGGARPVAKIFLGVHGLLALGFLLAWRTGRSSRQQAHLSHPD